MKPGAGHVGDHSRESSLRFGPFELDLCGGELRKEGPPGSTSGAALSNSPDASGSRRVKWFRGTTFVNACGPATRSLNSIIVSVLP